MKTKKFDEATVGVRGDGISGIASRSDMARARELRRHNLDMQWYDDHVEEQGGLCSDCRKPEKQRLGNGHRRPLGLGFLNGVPNRLICTNCAAKGRKERLLERNKPIDYPNFEDFWSANRTALWKESPAEFERLLARDGEIRELYAAVCDYVRGTDNCPEGLEDTLEEVAQELRENGTCDLDQLCVPFHQASHRQVFDAIVEASEIPNAPPHARATAIYARLGLLTALPVCSGPRNYIREFLVMNGRNEWTGAPKLPMVIIERCATHNCPGRLKWKPTTDPIPPAQWYCDACRAVSLIKFTQVFRPRPAEAQPFDFEIPEWFRKARG